MADAWNFDPTHLDEDADTDLESSLGTGGRDGIVFLVEATSNMLLPMNLDGLTFIQVAAKAIFNVVTSKIFSSDRDFVGVVLYGTDKMNNESGFQHVYNVLNLAEPCVETVKTIESFMSISSEEFSEKYGTCTPNNFSIADALWGCSMLLSKCGEKLASKRVLLLACSDDPQQGDNRKKDQAAQRGKDFFETGIDLEVIALQKEGGKKFDMNIFFKDLLFVPTGENFVMPDPAERLEELMTRCLAKDHKKRSLANVPLMISKDVTLSLSAYTLVRSTTLASAVKLHSATNEPLKTMTKLLNPSTGEVLLPSDVKKYQVYGKKRIAFDVEEVSTMKDCGTAGFTLIGFKPMADIEKFEHLRTAIFVYPNEVNIKGSRQLFQVLLEQCASFNKVAICKFIARKNTTPHLVALLPQLEVRNEHNDQVQLPGFLVIYLAFADDIRTLSLEEGRPRANTEQVNKAKVIIKKLAMLYTPEAFDNPAIQRHFRYVEAMALDRETPEQVEDFTLPNESLIKKRAGDVIQEFRDTVIGSHAMTKAKANVADDISVSDVENAIKDGTLGKMTVAKLKAYVCAKGLKPSALRKAALIQSIEESTATI